MASHPPCHGILDFSKVTDFEVSSAAIRQVAAAPPAFPAGYTACLSDSERFHLRTGAHVSDSFRRDSPQVRIVRTMEEANPLLEVTSPDFRPVNHIA